MPATGVRSVLREAEVAPLVLLVDDHQDARDLYSDFFAASGFRVAEAVDGDHALLKILALMPDVVVMDLAMPVLDGWEATRRLKAASATRPIPVIALTAHAMSSDRDKALEAGCDDYDTKPVELERLLGKIEVLLSRASGETPASGEPPS